jgi:hypothetical protein
VLAFLQVSSLLPVVELAQRRSAAKQYFSDTTTQAGWSFDKITTDFVEMLNPGNLNSTKKWLPTARLCARLAAALPCTRSRAAAGALRMPVRCAGRIIFSQQPDGAWDATSTLAFALEARTLAEISALPNSWWNRLMAVVNTMLGMVTGESEDARDAFQNQLKAVNDDMAPVGLDAADADASASRHASLMRTAKDVQDCPLTCHANSITSMMPLRLAAVAAEDAGVDARRAWATLCCIAALERLPVTSLWGDAEIYPEEERTIVDAGREWLEAHAEEHPALAEALEDGKLMKRAVTVTGLWRKVNKRRVHELRRSKAILQEMNASQAHRTLTGIYRAFVSRHSTFRVFLSEPLDGLKVRAVLTESASLACADAGSLPASATSAGRCG